MLNSGKKINILTLVSKNHNPPFKLNGRSLRNKKNDYLLQLYCAI